MYWGVFVDGWENGGKRCGSGTERKRGRQVVKKGETGRETSHAANTSDYIICTKDQKIKEKKRKATVCFSLSASSCLFTCHFLLYQTALSATYKATISSNFIVEITALSQ